MIIPPPASMAGVNVYTIETSKFTIISLLPEAYSYVIHIRVLTTFKFNTD